MKRIRLLYSDSRQGIQEEIQDFKQEPYVTYPRVHIIEHWNGHCTALVWYRYRIVEKYHEYKGDVKHG